MAAVSVQNATRTYPKRDRPAVDGLTLDIADGEFLAIIGPSGCGKTTSLRMLAGLEKIDDGRILIGDRDVTLLKPDQRNVAIVFQEYSLYPHMSVRDNIAFPLTLQRMDRREIDRRVQWAADLLDLSPQLRRKPKHLSGGQRQRVAMGRAIVRQPTVFLLDEPLSNLDEKMRTETRAHISRLQRDLDVTTVYVTHNQVEALSMADRICVLRDGRIEQVAPPDEIYDRPANTFVATFVGTPAMNIIEAPFDGRAAHVGPALLPVPAAAAEELRRRERSTVTVGIRPEDLRIVDIADGWPAQTLLVEDLGAAHVFADAQFPGMTKPVVIRFDGRERPRRGDLIGVRADPGKAHMFDPQTGERLPA